VTGLLVRYKYFSWLMIFPLQLLRAAKGYKLTNCHAEINR
jgi:hypothetical protein